MRLIFILFFSAIVMGIALTGYHLTRMTMMELVLCSAGEGGFRIPSPVCSHYMRRVRSDASGLDELATSGIDAILNLRSPEKYAIAEWFIGQGLDIDKPAAGSDLSALHATALYNDVERAAFLLAHGATFSRSDRVGGVTPLELALRLQREQPDQDRSELIALLAAAASD